MNDRKKTMKVVAVVLLCLIVFFAQARVFYWLGYRTGAIEMEELALRKVMEDVDNILKRSE